MASRREVLANIAACEKNGQLNNHVDPIDYSLALPVDENFHYLKKGFREKGKILLDNLFIIKPFIWWINRFHYHTKVKGRENLKGITNAVVTCNHVNIFDCLVAKKALKGHPTFITVAPFNNRKDWLGKMMRSGGILPFSENLLAMRHLNEAIAYHLTHNHYVMFYPEQSMWWNYEKPRPFMDGAYHYAIKHDVPVIPLFITFKTRKKVDKEGIPLKQFTIHILKPIFPQPTLSKQEHIIYLKTMNYAAVTATYEDFYQKKLIFE